MSNLLTELFFSPEEAEKLRVVEKISLARLRELATAECEGKLPKLMLGDKVYKPAGWLNPALGKIAEFTISMVSIGTRTYGWKYRASAIPIKEYGGTKDKYQVDFAESAIGSQYFLTQAEAARAEQAEKERDAAIDEMRDYCQFCYCCGKEGEEEPCNTCENVTHDGRKSNWKWRGQQEGAGNERSMH